MKKLTVAVMVWFLLVGISAAQSWDLTLDAGDKSISAGIHYRKDMANGYLKTGFTGLYTDDDATEYKWGALDLVVGNDTKVEGLRCEVGLKGILGDAEDGARSGDVGALAFTIHAGYLIPQKIGPVGLEAFSTLTFAPEVLSFEDTEEFLEASIGVGVHLIKNAILYLTYTAYDVEMSNGPGNWTLDDEVIRAGIQMHF